MPMHPRNRSRRTNRAEPSFDFGSIMDAEIEHAESSIDSAKRALAKMRAARTQEELYAARKDLWGALTSAIHYLSHGIDIGVGIPVARKIDLAMHPERSDLRKLFGIGTKPRI